MEFEQMESLIKAVSDSTLTEFKYEENGVKLLLKKETKQTIVSAPQMPMPEMMMAPQMMAAPAPMAAAPIASAEATAPAEVVLEGDVVKSPLVGTFYAAPAEDAAPFVKVGDTVAVGQVLAIVEAMKLMNEIESDFAGTVAEILVKNGDAVEYGQPLFRIV